MNRRTLLSLGGALILTTAATTSLTAQQERRPEVAKTHLKIGDTAPAFELRDHTGKTVSLGSYRGKKNVVLAFYVLAHTGG